MKPNILVFLSSVRPGRMADRVGKFVSNALVQGGMKATMFDPLITKFELVRVPIHFMSDPKTTPPWMLEAKDNIEKADGFIIVSTEYNSTIPPALTNMLDHFPPSSFRHRPCGIVTYAMSHLAGIWASTVLRPFVSELGMISLPTYVAVPMVHENVAEDGTNKLEPNVKAMQNLAKEMKWYVNALSEQKKKEKPPT